MTRDTRGRIAEYADTHPDAGVVEALGELSLAPAEWRDVVAAALDADDPHAALATDALEGGSPDANPTPDVEKSGCNTPEGGETDGSAERAGGDFSEASHAQRDPDGVAVPGADPDEPLGERDTTSVRHTSGDRDDPETDLNDGASGADSDPILTSKRSDPGICETDDPALAAFDDAIRWFHAQLDRQIDDHTDAGEHPGRATTAREWFTDVRGFDSDTLDEHRLGWAPSNATDELLAYLNRCGHDADAIRATGLFTEDLRLLWHGRYVFPYLDPEGRPAYAIARCTGGEGGGAAGYDGHPEDFIAGKYAKLAHTKDYVELSEPIFGLGTLDRDGPVLITEGVADAIRAHEYGYACLSPVTTQFKHEHREALLNILDDTDRPVYVVQDAERPPVDYTDDVDGWDALGVEQYGPGLKGAVRTAAYLRDAGVDAYLAELPRLGLDKVDLDDYLGTWSDTLAPVLASAHPPGQHPAHDPDESRADRDDSERAGWADVGQPGDSGRDLSADDVRDALSHVSNSLPYDDWIQLGYAVHDWDDGPRGKRIFKQWSRSSPKWEDPTSPRAIDWIWQNATPGGETTVATLVHRAKQGGWEPSRLATPSKPDYESVLPPAVRDLATATSGWDWRHAGHEHETDLSLDVARERTKDAIADAYERHGQVLVEALPTTGKSYGAVAAAAETDQPVTILTGRGRNEQYDQLKTWCDEHGLTAKTLPSFTRDCPTAAGEHGAEWRDTVRGWYRRGATPAAIHKFAEDVLGRPLPCQVDDDGNHIGCPLAHKWDFDPDEHHETGRPWDVLIGHYTHGYKEKVTQGRTVVFDEFPAGAYETTLGGEQIQGAVSYWLDTVGDAVPFDDYTDLVEHRDDESLRADALAWFLNDGGGGLETDESGVFDDESAHAAAPLATFAILAGDDLGNGFETADLQDVGTAGFDREHGEVSILRPPSLDYASGVVALDGTPTKRMWELSLGTSLYRRQVLTDDERREYIRDALNLNLVRTTEYVKPYNSPDHVAVDRDAALLEGIADAHDQDPALITTTSARDEYDAHGVLDVDPESGDVTAGPADRVKWYGDVLGSNEFADTRLGAVIGSNHYGDGFIKKWGAYAGVAVERNDEKGTDLSYGGFGDQIHAHMSEHDTLQAAMRFGRDGNGAVVYVHTDTLPEWVPLAGEGRVVETWSDGLKDVVAALEDLGAARAAEIAAHPAVDVGERQVLNHLETLRDERGVVDRDRDPEDGRRYVWRDDGLRELGEHGDVDLGPVDLEDLGDDAIHELARTSVYTWSFVHSADSPGVAPRPPGERDSTAGDDVATDVDPPPTGG